MEKFNFRSGNGQSAESLTPESFLARYFGSPEAFSTMVNDLAEFAPNLSSNLECCIDFAKLGYKVNSVIRRKKHQKTEMPYLYFNMNMRNGEVPLMLLNQGKLAAFLEDYQTGKVKIEFTYQELMTSINK
jgi:hypothetical protein